MNILNYECHVTIEPVFGKDFDQFEIIANRWGFKPAELLLQKTRRETPQRSSKDSFCTGHSQSFEDIHERMMCVVKDLKESGFAIWRYKIEGIVFDKRETKLYQIAGSNQ